MIIETLKLQNYQYLKEKSNKDERQMNCNYIHSKASADNEKDTSTKRKGTTIGHHLTVKNVRKLLCHRQMPPGANE